LSDIPYLVFLSSYSMSSTPVKQTTTPEQILNLSYPYELEIAESKQGSNHVLIVKSLKIRGDSPSEIVEEATQALSVIKNFLNGLNQT